MKVQSPSRGEKSGLQRCAKAGSNLYPVTRGSTFTSLHEVTPLHGVNLQPQSAVALVITLILLSVITFMTVTFLVVSRSEHNAVATTTDQAAARNAADTALQYAQLAVVAPILATSNEFNYSLTVSTNYINPWGFFNTPGPVYASLTNVSYDLFNASANPTTIPTPVTGNDRMQMIANLFYAPRVPVYVTNQIAHTNEFRFYYDINRNQKFDQTGIVPTLVNVNGAGIPTQIRSTNPAGLWMNANGVTWAGTLQVGDPQWVGILERPDFPHSSSNRFIARYAYMAVPSGQTLDVNYMHNYAAGANGPMSPNAGDQFRRDEGVGTWEENLAAFLADLNPNIWNTNTSPYLYQNTNLNSPRNFGCAFDDALSLLRYRYNANFGTNGGPSAVSNVSQMFGLTGSNAFTQDGIDGYSATLTFSNTPPVDVDYSKVSTRPWAGADNPSHFFGLQDFFDKTKTALGISAGTLSQSNDFTDRLLNSASMPDTFDQNTFFRMIAQLGTDSSPEPPSPLGGPKMNINYDNLVRGSNNLISATVSSTNFVPWRPIDFFYNAANRLLTNAGYTFTVTNIEIYPTNFYTPSVHRLLQLAANMFDATSTNNRVNLNGTTNTYPSAYPTVFRPFFTNYASARGGASTNIYIGGYTEVTNNAANVIFQANWTNGQLIDLNYPLQRQSLKPIDMVAGIPLIVGAKKGWPNFNDFVLQTAVTVTRNLEFVRKNFDTTQPITQTNQMYTLTISNILYGLDAWNSYSNSVPRTLQLVVYEDMYTRLTSNQPTPTNLTVADIGGIPGYYPNIGIFSGYGTNYYIPQGTWGGFSVPYNQNPTVMQRTYQNPLTNIAFLTVSNRSWSQALNQLVPLQATFERPSGFYFPHMYLTLMPRLRLALVDTAVNPNRIVDFVNLEACNVYDVTTNLATVDPTGIGTNNADKDVLYEGSLWLTNWVNAGPNPPTWGIINQIAAAQASTSPRSEWASQTTNYARVDSFRVQFPVPGDPSHKLSALNPNYDPPGSLNLKPVFNCPLPAIRTLYFTTMWEANDPLVHYTTGDLTDAHWATNNLPRLDEKITQAPSSPPKLSGLANLGKNVNTRYRPYTKYVPNPDQHVFDFSLKDPGITRSDDWNFTTNKIPNIGWLGAVHRGTPWQTVYMKSAPIDLSAWQTWSGNILAVTNVGQIATNLVALTNAALDSYFSMPTNDYRLFDLFTAALDDNATRGQLSVNQTNLAAWSAALSGLIVFHSSNYWTGTNWTVIQPVSTEQVLYQTNSPPVLQIINAINAARTQQIITTNAFSGVGFTNPPPANGEFAHVGDLLGIPMLTAASPYINPNASSDEVLEWLPRQIMGLLKCDHTPRFTIYCYGQALKPANHGIVLNGSFAGLCTNYQVTAESATRAVVRIDGAPLNPHAVLESFNVLPPE